MQHSQMNKSEENMIKLMVSEQHEIRDKFNKR